MESPRASWYCTPRTMALYAPGSFRDELPTGPGLETSKLQAPSASAAATITNRLIEVMVALLESGTEGNRELGGCRDRVAEAERQVFDAVPRVRILRAIVLGHLGEQVPRGQRQHRRLHPGNPERNGRLDGDLTDLEEVRGPREDVARNNRPVATRTIHRVDRAQVGVRVDDRDVAVHRPRAVVLVPRNDPVDHVTHRRP